MALLINIRLPVFSDIQLKIDTRQIVAESRLGSNILAIPRFVECNIKDGFISFVINHVSGLRIISQFEIFLEDLHHYSSVVFRVRGVNVKGVLLPESFAIYFGKAVKSFLIPDEIQIINHPGARDLFIARSVNRDLLAAFIYRIQRVYRANPYGSNGVFLSGRLYLRKNIKKK